MPHSFNIRLEKEISDVLKNVDSEIRGSGGSFDGDVQKGYFAGKTAVGTIRGEYRSLSSSEIEITITEKPFIVPYSLIEAEIRKYFS